MNNPQSSVAPSKVARIFLLAALAVVAALVYYSWGRSTRPATGDAAAVAGATTADLADRSAPSAPAVTGEGERVLNEAGLPVGPPLPPAKPIPVRAAPGDVVGYRKDANGQLRPMKAAELASMPANSPGTYAVVDMWADGGSVVVPPTPAGAPVSAETLERMRTEERGSHRPKLAN